MRIKDRIFNKMADFMYKYKSDDLDKISNCSINAKIKGAVITTKGEFVNNIDSKEQDGIIDIDKLLEQEIKKNDMQEIVLCDNGRIVCITNQKGASYVETAHEFFDLSSESVYVMCKSKEDYKALKEYLNQSSKWHAYVKQEEQIPYKETFEELFNIKGKEDKAKETRELSDIEKKGNIIQLDGYVVNMGKTFLKKDNRQAKYLKINQQDTYNGKTKDYTITVSMEDMVLEDYGNDINIGDKVRVTGKLINYVDKNSNQQSIVNSYDFEILQRANKKYNDKELEK